MDDPIFTDVKFIIFKGTLPVIIYKYIFLNILIIRLIFGFKQVSITAGMPCLHYVLNLHADSYVHGEHCGAGE